MLELNLRLPWLLPVTGQSGSGKNTFVETISRYCTDLKISHHIFSTGDKVREYMQRDTPEVGR